MKIIFLDIDGVLNANDDFGGRSKPNPFICGYCGISRVKVRRLKRIIDETGANVVLVSSWKYDYHDYKCGNRNAYGRYLRNKLRKDKIDIMDDTLRFDNANGEDRGGEIMAWLKNADVPVESWVALDDEIFRDYGECNILPHLIKTTEELGLTEELADKAIRMLNEEIIWKDL